MATYGTPTAPHPTIGYLVDAQARVLLGLNGASDLEATSWPAQTYSTPIGLAAGAGLELGTLANLNFASTPTFEAVEAANLQGALFYELGGEECSINVEVMELKPQTLSLALATGHLYILGAEALISWGGGCQGKEMPLVIEFTSQLCKAPTTPDIGSGITGGIITFYKAICTSGLNWAAFNATARTTIALTFQARHDHDRSDGNKIGNMYLY